MQPRSTPLRQNRLANLLMEASPVAIVLTDPAGIIDVVNHVTERWFGYRECELAGKSLETLFPTDVRSDAASQSACFLSQLLHPDTERSWNLLGRRKDETVFPVRVTPHPLLTVTGDVILANVMGRRDSDPVPQKQIEGERLSAITEMVAGLAHESRNALQRAQSCLDLLELDLAGNLELLHLTNRIRNALTDLRDKYEEVRDYAAPIVVNRSTVNLSELGQRTFVEIVTANPKRTCQLRCQDDTSCERVAVDAPRFRLVLGHLFENAIHASTAGDEIDFRCQRVSSSYGECIVMTIRDHGPGVTEEVANHMFEPFFTTKQHGTGLGLALCARIIDAHGGTIDAENHPDGGVLVRIVLPT